MNGRFVYLATEASPCTYSHTACWSHPGTYIGELGFLIQSNNALRVLADVEAGSDDQTEDKIKLVSGSQSSGMTVFVNGVQQFFNASSNGIALASGAKLILMKDGSVQLKTDDFKFVIVNSDYFFNLQVQLLRGDVLRAGATRVKSTGSKMTPAMRGSYPNYPMHGLLGQTWRNTLFHGAKPFEGDVMDYAIEQEGSNETVFGTEFVFNQYRH